MAVDTQALKLAARGRAVEIFATLGGCDRDILDGGHHPCPKCGGTDRFRLIDAEAGALYCNGCFASKNGDIIAGLGWLRGWTFQQTTKELTAYLGVSANGNGHATANGNGKASDLRDKVEWSDNGDSFLDALLPAWCERKPPIRPEAIKALGGKFCRWPKGSSAHRCIALNGRKIDGDNATLAAILLYSLDASEFPAFGSLQTRKTHLVKGSTESWVWAGTVEALRAAETIIKVEGPSDLLALMSIGLPAGWVAITNACGAKSANPKKLDFGWAAGKRIIIVGDADEPGQDGAKKFSAAFHKAGAAEVRIVALPYKMTPDHGKDLRDWLTEGHTAVDFQAMADAAPIVTPQQTAEWSASRKPSLSDDDLGLATASGRTEVANGCRLAKMHGKDFRWCDLWGKYLTWDTQRWAVDSQRQIDAMAKDVYQSLWCEITSMASKIGDDDGKELKELVRFAKTTGTARGIDAMLKLARSEPGIPIGPDVLDTDPWLLNCQNGTLDLRTGQLRPHRREDYLTKLSPVAFDRRADCPLWMGFLREIMAGDDELLGFLRRAVGMSLAGVVRDHVLLFLYGTGANGKSTFLNTLLEMMGSEYAMKAAPDLLLVKKLEGHPTERADLAGKRFIACVEAGEGRRLAESLVKELTGGDPIRARRMREDFWQFDPTHKVWLAANHKPVSRRHHCGEFLHPSKISALSELGATSGSERQEASGQPEGVSRQQQHIGNRR